jgi:hypothetical protein
VVILVAPTGYPNVATEEYNGSTWTAGTASLNTSKYVSAGMGTQTAALAFGGQSTSNNFKAATLIYDGSNLDIWSPAQSLVYSKKSLGGAGTKQLL